MVNSRDCQEIERETGLALIKFFQAFREKTSIVQHFEYFDDRQNLYELQNKKKTEECKIYKKQLANLKSAYDDLQRRSESSSTVSSTAEIASLQVSLSENTAQLEQARAMTSSLKIQARKLS